MKKQHTRQAAIMTLLIMSLIFNLMPLRVFALNEEGSGSKSTDTKTAHASISFRYGDNHVDKDWYDENGEKCVPTDTAGTYKPKSGNGTCSYHAAESQRDDKVDNSIGNGRLSIDVSYSGDGDDAVIDSAKPYLSGKPLDDMFSTETSGEGYYNKKTGERCISTTGSYDTTLCEYRKGETNNYLIDSDGNLAISAKGGEGQCKILIGKGNTIANLNKSMSDCQQSMEKWSQRCGDIIGADATICQFYDIKFTDTNGKVETINEEGLSQEAILEREKEAEKAAKEAEEAAKRACYDTAGPLGWIICPVIETIANFSAFFYDQIVVPQLEIQASSILNPSGGTYEAWGIFRDIANVIFAILFLLIVFSQITGFGIDNYGIKRMLPRLIVAAILINLSFFICQIAVDVANITGASIGNFISNIQNAGTTLEGGKEGTAGQYIFTFGAGIAIGTAAVMALGLGTVLLVLCAAVSIVISLIFMYVILIARQAAVVIFVAISPLALVFYLFPNTESLTKRWLKAFETMLLLYPICALVISGGQLAGGILASAASGTEDAGMVIAAMLVHVIPYLAIPTLVKNSMAGIGNLGAKIQGYGSGLSKRASKGLAGSSAFKNATTRLNNIDPGGIRNKFAKTRVGGAIGFRRRRMQQMQAENERRSEGLKYSSIEATNADLKDEKYQKMQEKAFDKKHLKENAEVWTSHYDGKSNGEKQADFIKAMKSNEANSGQIEGLIASYMDNEDFGGLQEAMAFAKGQGADEDAMKRAAEAMKNHKGFGKLSAKKASLGEWVKDPSKNFSTAMQDNIANFKQKDWASMDGDERQAAFAALDNLKNIAEHGQSEAERKAAKDAFTSAVNTMHAAASNQSLQGNMTHGVAEAYANYVNPFQAPATDGAAAPGQSFQVNQSTPSSAGQQQARTIAGVGVGNTPINSTVANKIERGYGMKQNSSGLYMPSGNSSASSNASASDVNPTDKNQPT